MSSDSTMIISRIPLQNMELAARHIDKSLLADNAAPGLLEQLNISPQTGPSASGLTDADFATLGGLPHSLSNITQIKTHSKVPLPPEVKEHFSRILFSTKWIYSGMLLCFLIAFNGIL